jgi:hypothetical protein
MSAVATAEPIHVSDAVPVREVHAALSVNEMNAAEQKRWMVWFGLPVLVMAIFVGATFGTGQAWWLALALGTFMVDICVLVWLAMTSDTNGLLGEPALH